MLVHGSTQKNILRPSSRNTVFVFPVNEGDVDL